MQEIMSNSKYNTINDEQTAGNGVGSILDVNKLYSLSKHGKKWYTVDEDKAHKVISLLLC